MKFVTNSTQPKQTIIYDSGNDITFIASVPMKTGQGVVMSADSTVALLTTASSAFPIGTVVVGTETAGGLVTVNTNFSQIHHGIASGGTLAAGALVEAVGTTTTDDDLSRYAVVTTGYCTAVVLQGGASGEVIAVGILSAPTKLS